MCWLLCIIHGMKYIISWVLIIFLGFVIYKYQFEVLINSKGHIGVESLKKTIVYKSTHRILQHFTFTY